MSLATSYLQTADTMIRQTGSRATRARIAVLEVLLTADHALTHTELEQALAQSSAAIERVTLYRVLDWLVSQELAHKVTGADRVWRFNAQPEPVPSHAHFNCSVCGKVYCLDNPGSPASLSLPAGFSLEKINLSIEGQCPDCSKTA